MFRHQGAFFRDSLKSKEFNSYTPVWVCVLEFSYFNHSNDGNAILGLEGCASIVLIRKIPWRWHPGDETCRRSIHVIDCIILRAFLVGVLIILIILICLFLFPSLSVSSSLTFFTYFVLSNSLFFPFFPFYFIIISIFMFLLRSFYFFCCLPEALKIIDLFYSLFEVSSLLGKYAVTAGEQFQVFRSIFVSSSSGSSNLAFSFLRV